MKKLPIAAAAVALLMSGCAAPVLSDVSSDRVKVQASSERPDAASRAEAERGCSLYGRPALYLSSRCIVPGAFCQAYEHLYACPSNPEAR